MGVKIDTNGVSAQQLLQIQQKSLKILLFFDSFCNAHNLTYFLAGGCCIGAIRNGAFIPWDDDIDVFMLREDYERMKELWVDTEDYSIQYTTKDYITETQIVTICDNHTTLIKKNRRDLDIHHGLGIEVLPLDGCPSGWRRKTQKIWAIFRSLFIVGRAPEKHGKLLFLGGKLLLSLVRSKAWRYRLWCWCERKMSRYPVRECDRVAELCSIPLNLSKEYPKEIFEKAIRVSFDGEMISVPVGYEQYLSIAFGDYRKLPPVEERVSHHEYEVIDMDRSYKTYRGTKYFVQKK